MDIYQVLKEDHRNVESLMEQLASKSQGAVKTRQDLFHKLQTELDAHARAEEETLYKRLKDESDARPLTLEAMEEHRLIDLLLNELSGMAVDSDEWDAKFQVLKENVEHHVHEEEEELFEEAYGLLSSEEAKQLGAKLLELKKHRH